MHLKAPDASKGMDNTKEIVIWGNGRAKREVIFVDDIAEAVTFLASDEAYYITGYILPVDGGMLAA